jgi:hypothetical protein
MCIHGQDPEERYNLAVDDEGRAIAERVFHEFVQDLDLADAVSRPSHLLKNT